MELAILQKRSPGDRTCAGGFAPRALTGRNASMPRYSRSHR